MFQDHLGNWWMVHLATRHPHYNAMSVMGRETFLLPVSWKDGWPVVNGNGKSRVEVEAQLLPPKPFDPEPALDEFDANTLRFCWNFLRNPAEGSWSLTEKPGALRLRGNAMNLDSIASPAFVGRRQEHFDCFARARVRFVPEAANEEAGLTCYMRDRYHYDIFLARRRGGLSVVVRKTVADIRVETLVRPVKGPDVVLQVTTDPYNYHLGLVENGRFVELDHASCQSVATETASVWTGMYFAMYSTGNGKPCKNPADFEWFEFGSE
jgi:alpha-N-arabinofuranosidase